MPLGCPSNQRHQPFSVSRANRGLTLWNYPTTVHSHAHPSPSQTHPSLQHIPHGPRPIRRAFSAAFRNLALPPAIGPHRQFLLAALSFPRNRLQSPSD
ncbi:hypothetical protein CC78DRAFT_66539 [Lojkania enalia]|uniref:Uncharacterized protein n=1 Tax=Lojkania enalia TaxID=147567 RepID=A0A9P4MYP4_9PLEO|nr:hypothetical protein CC78DRAFT_66539 [Didymosphaeria enalia]